jgi:hypothetical protein
MRKLFAILATTGSLAAILPAAADAHVSLTSFQVSPSCVTPGGSVTSNVQVRQNHWYHVHTLWARVQIKQAQTGVVVSQTDEGPKYVPAGDYSDTRTNVVPANAQTGDYNVTLLLGSTQGGSDWGTASRPLKVRALPILCS